MHKNTVGGWLVRWPQPRRASGQLHETQVDNRAPTRLIVRAVANERTAVPVRVELADSARGTRAPSAWVASRLDARRLG